MTQEDLRASILAKVSRRFKTFSTHTYNYHMTVQFTPGSLSRDDIGFLAAIDHFNGMSASGNQIVADFILERIEDLEPA